MIWTEEQDATLKRMWEGGEGGRAIAEVLGKSRNACIGRAHRRGYITPNTDRRLRTAKAAETKRHRADSHRTESIRKARIRAIKQGAGVPAKVGYRAPLPAQPIAAQEPMHLKLMELETFSCRYPYGGDRRGEVATFCGHRRMDGRPYCAAHMSITHYKAAR